MYHLAVLSRFRDVSVAAISSRGAQRIRDIQRRFGIPRRYNDFKHMLRDERLDAVYILVSADSVYRVALACMSRGSIPLFIEKPPGLTARETRTLSRKARRKNIPVMVGLNRRFYSTIARAQAAIERSGAPTAIAIEAPERIAAAKKMPKFSPALIRHWLVVNGIHCIDLLRFLGGDVKTVTAVRRPKNGDRDAAIGALIAFKNGAIGHYRAYWHAPGRWTVDLYGDGVRAHLEPLEAGALLRAGAKQRSITLDRLDVRFKPGFWRENRYFIDRVKDGAPIGYPAASIHDAVKTMELAELLRQ